MALISEWKLSGGVLTDTVGSNNLTANATAPTNVAGRWGTAATAVQIAAATGDYLGTGASPTGIHVAHTAFTIAIRASIPATGVSLGMLAGVWGAVAADTAIAIYYDNAAGNLVAKIRDSALGQAITQAAITAAVYHDIFMVYDSVNVSLYIDNITTPVATTPSTNAVNLTTSGIPFTIGGSYGSGTGGLPFSGGTVDDVRFYSHALSATERKEVLYLFDDFSGPLVQLTPESHRVLQRNNAGTNTLSVSGQYRTYAPTAVEAQVVNAVSQTVVIPWANIQTGPTGNAWSGTIPLVPDGGMYQLQLRDSAIPNVVSKPTYEFGYGMLGLLIGQSNPAHYSTETSSTLTPNAVVGEYVNGAWQVPVGDGSITLGNELFAKFNVPIGIVNMSVGSSALRSEGVYIPNPTGYWLDLTAGQPYDAMLTGVTAVGGSVEFAMWWQGESDALSGAVTETMYAGSFSSFITSQVRVGVGNASTLPNLPVFVTPVGGDTTPGVDADWQGIRNANYSANAITDVYVIPDALTLPHLNALHYTAAGYVTHAERVSNAVWDILGSGTYHAGPSVAQAVVASSTQLNLALAHTGGTDFTPTTGITGLDVLVGGVPVTVVSATQLDANTVKITTSGTALDVTATVRYLYGASPVVTNAIFDNSALLLPVNGFDQIASVLSDITSSSFEHFADQMYVRM